LNSAGRVAHPVSANAPNNTKPAPAIKQTGDSP
jgi:hypothetical protein